MEQTEAPVRRVTDETTVEDLGWILAASGVETMTVRHVEGVVKVSLRRYWNDDETLGVSAEHPHLVGAIDAALVAWRAALVTQQIVAARIEAVDALAQYLDDPTLEREALLDVVVRRYRRAHEGGAS